MEGLAEDGAGQGGDGEVAGDGAVVVVVQGEPGLVQGGGLFRRAAAASSWASTTAASCSTTSRARRAARRSRTGSRRVALATRACSTRPRSAADNDVGSREAAAAITVACAGDTVPAARAAPVAGRSSSRAVARRTSRAASAPAVRVWRASQALVPGRPGVQGDLGLVCGREQPQLEGLQPGHRAVAVGDQGGVLARGQRRWWCPACRGGRGSRARRPRPGGRCRGGGPGPLSCLDSTRTYVRIPRGDAELWR